MTWRSAVGHVVIVDDAGPDVAGGRVEGGLVCNWRGSCVRGSCVLAVGVSVLEKFLFCEVGRDVGYVD